MLKKASMSGWVRGVESLRGVGGGMGKGEGSTVARIVHRRIVRIGSHKADVRQRHSTTSN